MPVAEVVVRWGATLLDVRHVRAGEVFRVGTARDVDLALGITGSFPLVAGDDHVVGRVAAGLVARRGAEPLTGTCHADVESGRACARETRCDAEPIELRVGDVMIAVRSVGDPRTVLPHVRLDRRPPAYHAVSLVAHL